MCLRDFFGWGVGGVGGDGLGCIVVGLEGVCGLIFLVVVIRLIVIL